LQVDCDPYISAAGCRMMGAFMNAQERQLIAELFDRLSKLEQAPRDADAEAAIREGLQRAPNSVYALVQTVLVQDEALKRANAHIEELEAKLRPQAAQSGGFLDNMRDALFGSQQDRGSVPNVRPQDMSRSDPARPIWNSGQVNAQTDPRYGGGPGYGYSAPYGSTGGGGSFLGTAAAAAAGVIGGSLLMGSIRNLMGGHQAFADSGAFSSDNRAPWTDQSNSTLARDAGIDDIGRADRDDDNSRQSMFDQASNDDDYSGNDDDDFDADGDGFDSGDSDIA
jgi:uncharacterized protein